MHRKLWARLLSCVLALSVVLAAVPKPAQAVYYVVGDGGSYALMEYFRHRWPDGGYKIWTDYPQEFRAIISNGGNAFTNYSQRWVGMDYLIGKYGVTEPEDMGTNSAEVLSQLNAARQVFDDAWAQYQETNKPYQPGGIGGGSGNSGGGGEPSGPSVDDDYIYIPLEQWSPVGINSGAPASLSRVAIPLSTWEQLSSAYRDDFTHFYCVIGLYGGNNGYCGVSIGYTNSAIYNDNYTLTVNQICSIIGRGFPWSAENVSDDTLYLTTDHQFITTQTGLVGVSPIYWRYTGEFIDPGNVGGSGGGSGTVNPVPDPSTIEKPESPASPSSPQTPERESPTIVIGGTTQTVPDSSPAPDLSTIEQLLRLILANTNTIIEQMNSFSSQLGQALADQYDMIYDWFSATNSWLDQLQAQMTRQLAWDNTFFDWMKAIDSDIQYLQSVCQNGFSDVTSWLQNIFNRMVQGNGGGSKPGIVDPTDPSPVTDWLRQLWTSFLADLQMVLPDQVGAVVDFLDQLRQKFPFSIPWDIAGMLALLNHAPVTPVIDIPWGYAGDVQMIHVDCHAWDDAVEIVRPMFLLLFALCLALLTRDLLAGLEAVL